MKITPYQVVFKVPDDSSKSSAFGIPDISSMIEVDPEQDGTFVFKTHEKSDDLKQYYQIVFRITDPSPFNKDELHLSISNSDSQSNEQHTINDLYHDKKNDLWYQRSKYCYNKKSDQWEIKTNSRKNTYSVDCITTAGVFKVKVFRNSSLLTGPEFNCPWIYILPSSVSKEDYIEMLSDLMELNEQLVLRKSSIGIGALSTVEIETNFLRAEIAETRRLMRAIQGVMSLPSELLGKKYIKTSINKLRHFDSKTMRDYVKYGMSGQVLGPEFYEDHDTYENRVIKTILLRIESSLKTQSEKVVLSDQEIETEALKKTKNDIMFLNSTGNASSASTDEILTRNRNEFIRNNENSKTKNELKHCRMELASLLENKWFNHVASLQGLSEIRQTTKFATNRFYSEIYEIITKNYMDKPFLNSSFDVNAFGVISTHQVYEYWVLYKILLHLTDIGFEITNYNELLDHFRKFQNNKSLGPLKISIKRSFGNYSVNAEFGYNVPFISKAINSENGGLQRTPDYYLKIIHGNSFSWYFFDAKYKDFCFPGYNNEYVNCYSEIRDVAIRKYMMDLGDIFDSNKEYKSSKSDINGSYIIMANIRPVDEIMYNDRLFGSNQRIPNVSGTPMHRIGAIMLSPRYDKELAILFMLLFEYLETSGRKEHKNFNWCWKCNATNLQNIRVRSTTLGGEAKYNTTCPNCGDFRLITNCTKKHMLIKHSEFNFHFHDNTKSNQWAFVCPTCCDTL